MRLPGKSKRAANGKSEQPRRAARKAQQTNGTGASILQHPASSLPPPRHVAVIMDGNGRWAKQRGLSRQQGHRAGTENIRRIIQSFGERGVEVLTLYAFSTENWNRPRAEVNALMRLIPRVIKRELRELHSNGVRLVHIGDMEPLDERLRVQVEEAIELTKDNDRMTVALAFNYGGRAEIVDAVRQIVAGGVPPDAVDEALVSSHLYTAHLPELDLLIRTAGDQRISNFLLWQSAYAELYFTATLWPDFDEAEIDRALLAYADRERRFGGVPARNGTSHS
jgi:undecaprenyl diphosphate synthase